MNPRTLTLERLGLLRDLRQQHTRLTGSARERTARAIEQVERELARGRGEADQAQRRLDLEGAR